MNRSSLSFSRTLISTIVRPNTSRPANPLSAPLSEARRRYRMWDAGRERRRLRLPDGRDVLLRPIRPQDEAAHRRFAHHLSPEDIRARFFRDIRELPPGEFERLTSVDPEREMAFIASAPGPDGIPETLGVVRAVLEPAGDAAEVAIILRADTKGLGLGTALLEVMLRYARRRGLA